MNAKIMNCTLSPRWCSSRTRLRSSSPAAVRLLLLKRRVISFTCLVKGGTCLRSSLSSKGMSWKIYLLQNECSFYLQVFFTILLEKFCCLFQFLLRSSLLIRKMNRNSKMINLRIRHFFIYHLLFYQNQTGCYYFVLNYQ